MYVDLTDIKLCIGTYSRCKCPPPFTHQKKLIGYCIKEFNCTILHTNLKGTQPLDF